MAQRGVHQVALAVAVAVASDGQSSSEALSWRDGVRIAIVTGEPAHAIVSC